jgi:hypothetical protein
MTEEDNYEPARGMDEAVARGYMIEVDFNHPIIQSAGQHAFIEPLKNYERAKKPECKICEIDLGYGECSDCKLECLWQDRLVEEELARQRDLISRGINVHPNMRYFIDTSPARAAPLTGLHDATRHIQEPLLTKKCTVCNNVDIAINRKYCTSCKAARNSQKRREIYKRRKLLQ